MINQPHVVCVAIENAGGLTKLSIEEQEEAMDLILEKKRLYVIDGYHLGTWEEEEMLKHFLKLIPKIHGIVLTDNRLKAYLHKPECAAVTAAMRRHKTLIYTRQGVSRIDPEPPSSFVQLNLGF